MRALQDCEKVKCTDQHDNNYLAEKLSNHEELNIQNSRNNNNNDNNNNNNNNNDNNNNDNNNNNNDNNNKINTYIRGYFLIKLQEFQDFFFVPFRASIRGALTD